MIITDLKIMVEKVDRISGLPPFVIHHIMSYLSSKEVGQISTLSKGWNQLRISFPIFDFDQTDFLTEDESDQITSVFEERRLALRERLKEFMEYIDASLLRFCELDFCMRKFRLFISILDVEESAPYIDKWIGLATEKEVKVFDLEFLTDSDTPYTLPQSIFYAKSVTVLNIVRCKLENVSDIVRFNYLRKLSLDKVFINEEMVQKLSSESPLLEEMFLSECWGFKRLCVSKALKLKIMSIGSDELESVEVVAPNLQELVLEFSEEIMPRVIDVFECTQLKKLKFMGIGLTDLEFHHFISSFPLLEDLIFAYCYALERITISSNQLKKIRVSSCVNMKALNLDTPNLLSFTYEYSPIPTSCINALCPWQVKCLSKLMFDIHWCLKLREFLGVSNQIETLRIYARPTVVCV